MMAGLPVSSYAYVNSVRIRFYLQQWLLLSIFVFPVLAAAEVDVPVRSPEQIEGITRVDAEGLIELVGVTANLTVIDSRLTTNRSFGYIEGSVGLPDTETDCESLAGLVPDKALPVLFYCNGPKCGRSVVAAKQARECGYTSIYWFRGGIEEWRDKGYPLLK